MGEAERRHPEAVPVQRGAEGDGSLGASKMPGIEVVAVLVFGMAFFWQYLRNANVTALMGTLRVGIDADAVRLAYYSFALIVSAAAWAVSSRGRARVGGGFLAAYGVGLTVLTTDAMVFAQSFPVYVAGPVGVAALLLFATVPGLSATIWLRTALWVYRSNPMFSVLAILLSSVFSIVLPAPFFTYGLNKDVFIALLPVLSCVLCYLGEKKTGSLDSPESSSQVVYGMGKRDFVPLVMALLIVTTVMRGLYSMPSSYGPQAGGPVGLNNFITVVMLLCIIVFFMFATRMEVFAYVGWLTLTVVVSVGLFAVSINSVVGLSSFDDETLAAGRTSSEALLFTLVMFKVGSDANPGSQRRVHANLLVPELLACIVGYGLPPILLGSAFAADPALTNALFMVTGALALAMTVFVMNGLVLERYDAPAVASGDMAAKSGSGAAPWRACRHRRRAMFPKACRSFPQSMALLLGSFR